MLGLGIAALQVVLLFDCSNLCGTTSVAVVVILLLLSLFHLQGRNLFSYCVQSSSTIGAYKSCPTRKLTKAEL